MKKILKAIVPLLVFSGSMTACTSYSVKPGPLKNLVGTYELVKYEMKHNQDDKDTYDRKKEIGAVAYFSIAEDGYSYYVYKDNKTAPKFSTMFGVFEYNSDEDKHPEYVRSVSIKDGVTHLYEDQKYVGCFDEPSMGFRNDAFKKILHYTLSGHMLFQKDRIIPYQYVEYKRVSEEASLAKVNQLMGTSFTVDRPFECKALKGYLVYRCNYKPEVMNVDSKGAFDYAVLDANTFADGKFTVHYALKADHIPQTVQVPVTVETKGYSFSLPFANSKFYGNRGSEKLAVSLETKPDDYPAESEISWESFTNYYSNDLTLDEIIEQERTPEGAYVMHRVGTGQKEFNSLSYNENYEYFIEGLELAANEEFAICMGGNMWHYFDSYEDEGTANDKIVQGSVAARVWDETVMEEVDKYFFKATEAGSYNILIDNNSPQKVHIVHE